MYCTPVFYIVSILLLNFIVYHKYMLPKLTHIDLSYPVLQ